MNGDTPGQEDAKLMSVSDNRKKKEEEGDQPLNHYEVLLQDQSLSSD